MIGARVISFSGSLLALGILLSTLIGTNFLGGSLHISAPKQVFVKTLPLLLGDWQGEELADLGVRSRQVLQLDHWIRRLYTNKQGEKVFLYIGYWKKQSGEYQAAKHSPAICLPANGWRVSGKKAKKLRVTNDNTLSINSLIGEYQQSKSLFYYWFFSGEKTYHEEWEALLQISLQTLLHGRSDGGIIEVSTNLEGVRGSASEEVASKALQDFITQFNPELKKLLQG